MSRHVTPLLKGKTAEPRWAVSLHRVVLRSFWIVVKLFAPICRVLSGPSSASQFGHIYSPSSVQPPQPPQTPRQSGVPTMTGTTINIVHNEKKSPDRGICITLVQPFHFTQLHYTVQYCHPRCDCTTTERHSVFVLCSCSTGVTTLDLSGSNAATSSIFLNCHGNLDGYRNGRMSKPVQMK